MVYFLFISGFILLVFGAKWLVDGASALGLKWGMPPLVIGMTIVAAGTSLPELVINVFASIGGKTDLAISNVVGSNIMNILLIIGITATITPIAIQRATTVRDIPVSFLSALLIIVLDLVNITSGDSRGFLSFWDGWVFIIGLVIYLYYSFRKSGEMKDEILPIKHEPLGKSIVLTLIGLVSIGFSGRWIVDGTEAIAGLLGISDSEVGLFITATATSLPELVTSVMAALRKKVDIAMGNALGSCIMNIFLILGISALITPLPLHREMIFDQVVLLFANALVFAFVFIGKGRRIDRWEGVLMVAIYAFYVVFRLQMG